MTFAPRGIPAARRFHIEISTLTNHLQRLLTTDDGQDLIEYALLASFLGFTTVAGVTLIRTALNTTYTAWDAAAQSDELVEVPDPK